MTEPENQAEALTRLEAVKNLAGMVRAEAESWREPQDYEPRDAVEEAAFLDVVAGTLEALASLPEAPAVPVVRALEWDYRNAQTLFGTYTLSQLPPDANETLLTFNRNPVGNFKYPTLEAAKAAAQSDFETRIRSALQSSPPVKAAAAVDWETAWRDKRIAVLEDCWQKCAEQLHEVAQERNALEGKLAALASQNAVEGEAVATEPIGCIDRHEQKFASAKTHAINTLIAKGWTPVYASPRPAAADAWVREALAPAAFVNNQGVLFVPDGSPLVGMLKGLPAAPFGEEILPLYTSPSVGNDALRQRLVERGIDGDIVTLIRVARPDADARLKNTIHVAVLDALSLAAKREQAR